jgi:hypothetical protein
MGSIKMRSFLFLLVGCLALASHAPLRAASALNSSGQTAAQVEDLGEIVEADADVPSKIRANVTIRGEFTSNAELTGHHDSNDFIFLPTLDLGFTQPLGPKFSLDVAAKVELGLYANHDERAFVGYNIKTTLDWHPNPNLPRLYIAAEPYRYDALDIGERITQGIGLSVGTDWGKSFNNGHSLLFTGLSYTGYLADPTSDTRNALRAVIGVTHQFREDLTGQILYAWQYSDFINFDRHDSKHLVALNLIYQLNQKWFATLGGAFVDNDSDMNPATYQSVSGSLGVTYQF